MATIATIFFIIICTVIIVYTNNEIEDELLYLKIETELLRHQLKQEKTQCNENK